MAYKIRPTSINDIEKLNFRNINELKEMYIFLSNLLKDNESFAIDDKDSTKIKILPQYKTKEKEIKQKAKELKLKIAFGKGSDKFKVTGAAKTVLQEVGVLVYLDTILENIKELENYKPSKRLSISAKIEDVIEFLQSDETWDKACKQSAETIYKNFGSSLKNYTFHHDDNLFNTIRKIGKELSGLSNFDKWNPSDIYLVKKWNPDTSNIIAYNNYVFNEKTLDVIGISLKKGEKEALHGAIALNVVNKKFGKPSLSVKFNKKDEKFVNEMTKLLLKIKQNKFADKIYCHTNGKKTFTDSLNNIVITSPNYFKSIPVTLEFLANAGDDLEDILKFAALSAMSISPNSCTYYKVEGNKLSIVPAGKSSIEIKRLRIKLNGDTDCIADYVYNNNQYKLQIRSKGSLPQFIVVKTAENPKDIIPIKSIAK